MQRTLGLLLLVLMLFAPFCGGCGPDLWADVDVANLGLQRPGAWAVWTRDARGRAVTYFLDERGEERSREPGIVLRTRAGELLWREERVAVPTVPCVGFPELPPGEGWETRGLLVPRAGASIEVDPPRPQTTEDEDGWLPNELASTLELRGSAGSLLFLHRSTYAYACGVHGNTAGDTFTWDLEARARVDLRRELARDDLERAAREAVKREVEEDEVRPVFGDALRLTGLVPRYDARGLRLEYQLTADTCYACTKGDAGSYTTSELVGSQLLPASLAPHALLPEAVARFARSHPELTLGGYGGDEREAPPASSR